MIDAPPEDAVEVQSYRRRAGNGILGTPSVPGQSQIMQKGEVAWVALSRGLWAIIDAEDVHKVEGVKWSAKGRGRHVYACAAQSHAPKLGGTHMHRVVVGNPPDMEVDHIHESRRDNRKGELRVCAHAENLRNRGKTAANTSGYKGVSFDKKKRKWSAKIRKDYRQMFLGYFDDKEAARDAYVCAALQFHGAFAKS